MSDASICVTPSLDCKLAPQCSRHFKNQPSDMPPNQRYMVNLGDNALFACPRYQARPTSQGALS